jgi:5-methylcytosine-specific restriction endonuclease McrA
MNLSQFRRLSSSALVSKLEAAVASERCSTVEVIALLAEFGARKLFRASGYSTLYRYCLGKLHMSEDAAYKRMQAARVVRAFPVVLEMLADGRLHLSAVVKLAPRLTEQNLDELLLASTHRSKAQVEKLIAERFPQPDVPTLILAVPTPKAAAPIPAAADANAPSEAAPNAPGAAHPLLEVNVQDQSQKPAPEPVVPSKSGEVTHVEVPLARARVQPISPEKYAMQVTILACTRDKMLRAQELLSHGTRLPESELLDRAFDALLREIEKAKFAVTDRPREPRGSKDPRCIPAHVKRTVLARDGGRCTFVSADGTRCESFDVEFDHVLAVARGGQATVANVRLRCRAHNQLAAEDTFGAGFMENRRRDAAEQRARVSPPTAPAPASSRSSNPHAPSP